MNVNELDQMYFTPLVYAARDGDYTTVKKLIENGALVDGDARAISTPLISSARNGYYEVVEYLIECGADINRLQTKFNQTALDIAMVYEDVLGSTEIIELLKSKGATNAQAQLDFLEEKAGGILWTIENDTGKILSSKISQNTVDIRIVLLDDDKKNKLLLTIGLFQKLPRCELMLCIPIDWPVNAQLLSEDTQASFPLKLLFALATYRLEVGEIHEGFVIEKCDAQWSGLCWPEEIDAFIVIDYEFGDKSEHVDKNDETVTLFLLTPIKYLKSGCPRGKKLEGWIEKHKTMKWTKNALKYDHLSDISTVTKKL